MGVLTDEGFEDDFGCCATVFWSAGGCRERKRMSTTPTGANDKDPEEDLSVVVWDSSGDMGEGERPGLECVVARA